MAVLSTLLGYLALAVLAVGATLYYHPSLLHKVRQPRPPIPEPKSSTKKPKRPHARRVDGEEKETSTPASGNEGPPPKRPKTVSAPIANSVKVTTTKGGKTTIPRDDNDEISNRQFAEELKKAQAGTKLEKSTGSKEKSRTVKQGKAFESPTLSSQTSSTGGVDGDDDMSPVGSPPSEPLSSAPTSRAGDVSDMLEPQAAKRTTLRLTDIQEKAKPKQQPKKIEETLSKRQRQRQKKAEEQAQLNALSNKEHEAKKQNQIRGARMAEGTSNQTKANAFNTTQNAWKKSEPAPASQPTRLLDTFDPAEQTNGEAVTTQPLSNITNGTNLPAAKKQMGENKVNAQGASTRERPDLGRTESWADEVNEEAEDDWAKELTGPGWEPVSTKKGKKAKKETDTSSENSSRPKENVSRPKQNGGIQKPKVSRVESSNRFQSMDGDVWEA